MNDKEFLDNNATRFIANREKFGTHGSTWRRIYGPHFDADALWSICKDANLDYRRDDG